MHGSLAGKKRGGRRSEENRASSYEGASVKENKSRTVQCEEILRSSYRIGPPTHANKTRVVINTRKLLVHHCAFRPHVDQRSVILTCCRV